VCCISPFLACQYVCTAEGDCGWSRHLHLYGVREIVAICAFTLDYTHPVLPDTICGCARAFTRAKATFHAYCVCTWSIDLIRFVRAQDSAMVIYDYDMCRPSGSKNIYEECVIDDDCTSASTTGHMDVRDERVNAVTCNTFASTRTMRRLYFMFRVLLCMLLVDASLASRHPRRTHRKTAGMCTLFISLNARP
jgi:hypothetical protein